MATNSSVEQCMAIIRELESNVTEAKKVFISPDLCMVNRDHMVTRLRQLYASLPTAMTTAEEYVRNIELIRQQTEQECSAKLLDAQQTSQKMLSEAEAKAESLTRQSEKAAQDTQRHSQEQAAALLESAQSEARRVIDEATRHADALVQHEEIVRRARVEASEAREQAEADMHQLRKNTFDYLDHVMEQADRSLSELVSDIRNEHGALNNARSSFTQG